MRIFCKFFKNIILGIILFTSCKEEIDLTKYQEYDWSKVDQIKFVKIPSGFFNNIRTNGWPLYQPSAIFKIDSFEISKHKITVGQYCKFLNDIKPEISSLYGYEVLKYNGQYIAFTEKFWHGGANRCFLHK
jgi:formylglycine-generating enzyme required for sulfatase activity